MYKVSQIRRSQVRPLPKISFISSPLSNSLNNEVIRRKTTKYDHHTRETRLKRLEIEYIKSQQHWGSIYKPCGLSSLLIGGEGFPKVNEVALFGNRKYLRKVFPKIFPISKQVPLIISLKLNTNQLYG